MTSDGANKTRRPVLDCVRGKVEETLALETLGLIVGGGRGMNSSIRTWFRVW